MEVRILGPLEVSEIAGGALQAGPKERVVLARLAVAQGRAVSDDALMDVLWGDDLPASARKGLNGYVYRLRRLMGEERIIRTSGGYALDEAVTIDLCQVEQAAETARLAVGENRLRDAAEVYQRALSLFRGEALPELADDDTARIVRRKARELKLCIAEEHVEVALALGRHASVVSELEEVVATDPTRERAWAQLATALAASGRQADALDALARAKRALALELGIEPGPRLREVEHTVLDQTVHPREAPRAPSEPDAIASPPFPPLLSAGLSAPYIGRAAMMEGLAETRREAVAGRCRAVLLVGEPGVGKTRTATEVARAAFGEGAIVLYGRCDEDLAVPYQPFVEALDWYTAHAAAPVLGRHPGELSRLQPLLASRVQGLAPPVSSDPRSEEYLLFEATKSWLFELARHQPLVLVVDDLHWASKPVLVLLLHVLRAAAAAGEDIRLLVVGAYRNSEVDRDHPLVGLMGDLRRIPIVEQLAITGLSSAEVEDFVSRAAGHVLGDDGRRFAEALQAETEGNPFFVGEVLRHLVETGMVRRHDDGWVFAAGAEVTAPEGVRDVVRRRLGRLSPEVEKLLSVAAVVGRDFDVELLAALSEAPEARLLDALDEAVQARLIDETAADRYRFTHVLVRTTLYEDLSGTRRRRVHRRVGEAIEKLRPTDVVALAHHFGEAGGDGADRTRVLRYTLAAAEHALEVRALADAETRFRRALGLADAGPTAAPERLRALCGLGQAQRDQGDPTFRTTLLDAGRLADEAGDAAMLVRAVLNNSRGVPSVIGGVDAERVALTEAALELVGPEPSAERARLLAQLAAEITFTRDCERRLAVADSAEDMSRALGDDDLLAWVLNRTGYAAFAASRIERLVARGEEATRLSDAGGDPAQRVLSRYFWAGALLTAGDIAAFRRVTKAMLELSDEAAPTLQWLAQVTQARLCLLDGDAVGVRRINDEAFQFAQDLGEPDGPAWWGAILGPLEWTRGGFGTLADVLRSGLDAYPDEPAWTIGYALSLAVLGRLPEARAALKPDLPGPRELLDHAFPLFNLFMLAVGAFHLDDADLAAQTAEMMQPYGRCWVHQYAASLGPASLGLALCAAVAGDLDEAAALCEETERVLIDSECPGFLPMHRTYQAEILRRRGSEHDRQRAAELVDQVRRHAADFEAPHLLVMADDLTARLSSGATPEP